jgi:hypothetical protein
MTARTRWVVVGGGLLAHVLDAMEIILLSLALPAIRENQHLTAAQGQPPAWSSGATTRMPRAVARPS